MKNKKAVIAVIAVVLSGYGACRAIRGGSAPEAQADPKLFFNRAWLEREPEKPTDKIHGLFALARRDNGIFFEGSSFVARFERFDFQNKGEGKLDFTFPQDGRKGSFSYTVTSCQEKDGFDLCLDLSKNPWGGPKRYYGATKEDSLPGAARAAAAEIEASDP